MSESPLQKSGDPSPVVLGPPHPCPYLGDRTARFAYVTRIPDGTAGFAQLLNAGFRRSGLYIYRTACQACTACRALRIPVARFAADRSQRRALKINEDLEVSVGTPRLDDERANLFARYLAARHDGQMSGDRDEIQQGLYASPVETMEISARLDGRLVVCGIIDIGPRTVSLVYSAWDPDLADRSLGTAFILWSIALAGSLELATVHLGYWVDEARTMTYKTRFQPHEIQGADGQWRASDGGPVTQDSVPVSV